MKVLIVYDSTHGNTGEIAGAIGKALPGDVKVVRPGEVNYAELGSIDLLVVGSPTLGGRPTPAVQEFLNKIPRDALKEVNAASFDTRFSAKWVKIFGYASDKIAASLKTKGVKAFLSTEGFFLKRKEGPLDPGEPERAADWAKRLVGSKS